MTGTAGQQRVPRPYFEGVLFPLPPLAEQQRIVQRVESLLAATAALKESLAAAQAEREILTAAALHRLENANPAQSAAAWALIRENFASLIDTPESVAALKQTILQLAVQGKLVPQQPDDEPATELLARIRAEKARLEAAGEIRKSKPLAKVKAEEMPFALPQGWVWCRFGDAGELARGKSKHRPRNDPALYEEGKYPFIQTGDVSQANGYIRSYTQLYSERGLEQSRLWPKRTLCITIAANIAQTGILDFEACFPDSIVGFRTYESLGTVEYFQYFIAVVQSQLEAFAPSTAQKNINLEILTNLPVPLPPLAEQQRIVERVEALFALCDGLAAELAGAEETRGRWVAAVLAGV